VWRCRWLGISLMVALAGLACDRPTPARIAKWRSTERGPERLMETLQQPRMAQGLRAAAALALVDIGLVAETVQVGMRIPALDRWDLLTVLIPAWDQRIKHAPAAEALNARDALFAWRSFAAPEQLEAIDLVLLAAIEPDLHAQHGPIGRYTTENMVVTIGTSAGPMLVRVLRDPKAPYVVPACLLATVGDAEQRAQGVRALLLRAQMGPAPLELWNAIGWLNAPAWLGPNRGPCQKGFAVSGIGCSAVLAEMARSPVS